MRERSARSTVRLIMCLSIAGIIFGATPARAQVLYGSIVGNVKDPQESPVRRSRSSTKTRTSHGIPRRTPKGRTAS